MGIETQSEYFVSKSEGVDGKTLSIFHAPPAEGFAIPKEVLRVRSAGDFASRSLWNLITGNLSTGDYDTPSFEPSSVEQVSRSLDEFMRTQSAGGIFVDDEAPDEIKNALQAVEEALNAESKTTLADLMGIDIQTTFEDDRPYPGLYL